MSRKLLLDQSSEIVSQQLCDGCGMLFRELSRFVLERCICSHKGLTDSIYPHGNQSYLAQQKGKCSCKYISGGIFKSESHYCIVGYVEYDMEADLDSWQKLLDFGEVGSRAWTRADEVGKGSFSPIYVKRFDIGKEKEVKLVKKCLDGKFFYKNSGDMLQTSSMKDSDPQKFWCSAHQKCYMFGRRGSFNS
ncbi:hypothetical protein IGI04_027085 [Brassica rapa subsp. trilocularis]|uniref:Uncharacterized protein n=1 Tax=Brassica rapa subsp. trilocularis TaxID=1813537 RepID=A0ABQ7L1N3_BRACM|nr:hypothetical protein IGI04_027085 [Brassica rapa subsp. trilocularis]